MTKAYYVTCSNKDGSPWDEKAFGLPICTIISDAYEGDCQIVKDKEFVKRFIKESEAMFTNTNYKMKEINY